MRNLEIKNIDCHAALAMTKSKSGATQIKFNQAEDALTIPAESRHDHKCGYATQRGRSMIEMLGVLAIIGVLSVGGIAGYSKAMMKYRINKTIEQTTLIAGNVRTFFAPQKNYIGVTCESNDDGTCDASGCRGQSSNDGCPIVKKAKIFPDEIITVEGGKITSITNPFGGGVRLFKTNKSQRGDSQAFFIYYYGLPQEACIELTTHDWSNAGASIININDSYNSKTPMDLEIATQYCDDENEIWLYFDVDANSTYWTERLGEY